MAFAYTDFTAAFPEFGNATTFPQTQIAFWETLAYEQLDVCRFGASLDLAAMLYVAHMIAMSAQNAAQAASNGGAGVPGQSAGPVTSKSAGGVSKSMDAGAVTYQGAGSWNETQYGRRLYEMMRRFSLGGMFVPGPRADPSRLSYYGLTNLGMLGYPFGG